MYNKFDFSVVAMGERGPDPDRIPRKSRYTVVRAIKFNISKQICDCPSARMRRICYDSRIY